MGSFLGVARSNVVTLNWNPLSRVTQRDYCQRSMLFHRSPNAPTGSGWKCCPNHDWLFPGPRGAIKGLHYFA